MNETNYASKVALLSNNPGALVRQLSVVVKKEDIAFLKLLSKFKGEYSKLRSSGSMASSCG